MKIVYRVCRYVGEYETIANSWFFESKVLAETFIEQWFKLNSHYKLGETRFEITKQYLPNN